MNFPEPSLGFPVGTFTSSLTGLAKNTIYYVRAYATNSLGTAYGTEVSFTTTLLEIGDSHEGGIIAYFFLDGVDAKYVNGEVHGLIAATTDQSAGIQWYNGSNITTGATGTAIGTGLANTNTIISSYGEPATIYAAGLARAYTGGNYNDWYLPSKDELYALFINRIAIGGFDGSYWSSTEWSETHGMYRFFFNGSYGSTLKYSHERVRAVRTF